MYNIITVTAIKNDNTHDKHDNLNVHDILHTRIITATKTHMCAVLFQGCPRTARLKSYRNIPNTAHAYIHPYVHTYTHTCINTCNKTDDASSKYNINNENDKCNGYNKNWKPTGTLLLQSNKKEC